MTKEELEKENAELIQENEEMKNGLGCETCQIHLEYMSLNNRIADLEKENAELKEKYVKNICDCDICDTYCNSQLIKAKEIIKKIEKIFYSGENAIKRLSEISDILAEAEQFLNSEVEK